MRRTARSSFLPCALACALLASTVATEATAAPTTVLFEGVLRTPGGGPVSDGDYKLTFALYAAQNDANPLWTETIGAVAVKGGVFVHGLGTATAIPDAALAAATLLGVQVDAEPELPRVPLHAVAYARRAGVAEGLACTGCVSVAALAFDGDVDLGGQSLKAKNALFSGDLTAKTVTAQSFLGDGSKLTGIATVSGSCKSGEAVVGVGVDNKVVCAPVVGGGELSTLTGGLLSNRITTTVSAGGLPIAIPDSTGAEAVAMMNVTEAGKADKLSVSVKISNSDLAKVRVVLLPPDDKAVGITLCDPCGGTDEKSLDLTWPPTKEKSGSLAGYLGKSVKGMWTLKVLDSGFCIPQAPGNAAICDVGKGIDGALLAASIQVEVLSTGTVSVPGTLIASSGLQLPTWPAIAPACGPAQQGSTYLQPTKGRLVVCDGADWRTLPFEKACGNEIVSGDEECDDGNSVDTDACTNACTKAICGDKIVQAGVEECDDGNTKSDDGCSSTCKSEVAPVGCADGTEDFTWNGEMVACDGNFLRSNYETACASGWHPANPNEYATYGGKTKAPNKIYWVDTAWDAQGKDTSLKNWAGFYDSSNGAGWNSLSQNSNCTWIASPTEACYLSFSNHDYGQLKGCHCRGGNPNSEGHGVVCVQDNKALPRL